MRVLKRGLGCSLSVYVGYILCTVRIPQLQYEYKATTIITPINSGSRETPSPAPSKRQAKGRRRCVIGVGCQFEIHEESTCLAIGKCVLGSNSPGVPLWHPWILLASWKASAKPQSILEGYRETSEVQCLNV